MTRSLLMSALVFQFASGFAALQTPLAGATDLSEKVVHLGFVFPGGPDPGMKEEVFWTRLRTLGWEEGRNLKVERRYTRDNVEGEAPKMVYRGLTKHCKRSR